MSDICEYMTMEWTC